MGLAAAKNKRKWAKDPNNTAWSRNTDTFGHKILRSQGWEPGQYLGAKDASHSEFYGAANASHVRAVLKDDNLGLGARRNQGDECTGLDALQELLGRLNGRSEESLSAERKKREDVRVSRYLERKLGTIRFVYGGLLVGDKVQALADELKREKEEKEAAAAAAAGEGKKEKKSKSKKRKAEEDDDDSVSDRKKEKKSKKRRTEDEDGEPKSTRKEKKDKKKKDKSASTPAEPEEPKPHDDDDDAPARKKSKKEKKEKRKKSKDEDDADPAAASDSQTKKKKKRRADKDNSADSSKSTPLPTETSTPTTSGTSTPLPEVPHRHLARKRFIAQKRAAVMDPAALNQIFMIKA